MELVGVDGTLPTDLAGSSLRNGPNPELTARDRSLLGDDPDPGWPFKPGGCPTANARHLVPGRLRHVRLPANAFSSRASCSRWRAVSPARSSASLARWTVIRRSVSRR